jgi:hypothetical protein
MEPEIYLKGVTKVFGRTRAVDKLDLTVPRGGMWGLERTTALVAGLAVYRRRRGIFICRNLVCREGLPDRSFDVRQASQFCDTYPLGAIGVNPGGEGR